MKRALYPRLAWMGLRKNSRFSTPFVLTCAGMVMMHYIIAALPDTALLTVVPGAEVIRAMLAMGRGIIMLFAALFLFYTHSFAARGRMKEYGLYYVLGMGKMNIVRTLLWETLLTAAAALAGGLLAGAALCKLAELCMARLLCASVNYDLWLSLPALRYTVIGFGVIFALLFAHSVWMLCRASAISLLHSEKAGEKPPRANWIAAAAGAALLGAAYALALSIRDPLSALAWFFGAVAMVIAATYLLFIAGSVTLCRALQKNPRYYYQTRHFISVSSMAYRMRRNGAGLASICILGTMVLVMLSSTACLYFGMEDSLHSRYPREFLLEWRADDPAEWSAEALAPYRALGGEGSRVLDCRVASIAGQLTGTEIETDSRRFQASGVDAFGQLRQLYLVPVEDYNRMTGAQETLAPGEILLCPVRTPYEGDSLSIRGVGQWLIRRQVEDFSATGEAAMLMTSSLYLIVPDFAETIAPLLALRDERGRPMLQLKWTYGFDTALSEEEQLALYARLRETLRDTPVRLECRAFNRQDFLAAEGGLFFLGVILSLVFLFAAVLIIYYKQMAEGYEDQARFAIMQKVGLSRREIRRSINSQMLTVFFLPLGLAGVHLCFAFPMVRKLLMLFNFTNQRLLAAVTALCYLLFALFYLVVYRCTSNAYCAIVSGAEEER